MFEAILHDDREQLTQLGVNFARRDQQDRPRLAATLLCLNVVFAEPLDLRGSSPSEIATCFERFLLYARTLQRLSCLPNAASNDEMGKLFAFVASDNEHISLSKTSHLVFHYGSDLPISAVNNDAYDIPRWDLEKTIKVVLKSRLSKKVNAQNDMCHGLRVLQPCLLSAVYNRCPRQWCDQYHMDVMGDVTATYNTFVRIHMLQIMIFHTLYATETSFEELEFQQR